MKRAEGAREPRSGRAARQPIPEDLELPVEVTVPQAAELLEVSRQAIYEACTTGRLPARKLTLGKKSYFLIPTDLLRAYAQVPRVPESHARRYAPRLRGVDGRFTVAGRGKP